MECKMAHIEDYPGYGFTKDGRVWSYKRNKFLSVTIINGGACGGLTCEGITVRKLIRRLIFEAFYGYLPEAVINKDGNPMNNHLDNLEGLTWSEYHYQKKRTKCTKKYMYKLEIATGKVSFVYIEKDEEHYSTIHSAVNRYYITSGDCMYFYPGEKEKLIVEIKSRIYSNNLAIQSTTESDFIKKHNKNHEKCLELLQDTKLQ